MSAIPGIDASNSEKGNITNRTRSSGSGLGNDKKFSIIWYPSGYAIVETMKRLEEVRRIRDENVGPGIDITDDPGVEATQGSRLNTHGTKHSSELARIQSPKAEKAVLERELGTLQDRHVTDTGEDMSF